MIFFTISGRPPMVALAGSGSIAFQASRPALVLLLLLLMLERPWLA